MGKKMLILGGGGFIGTNAIQYFLNKNYDIYSTLFINPPKKTFDIPYQHCYLTNRYDVGRIFGYFKPDIVLHFAAVTTASKDVLTKPYIHVKDNVIMNALVLEEAFLSKIEHCIFTSCTVMYPSREYPQSEDSWNESDIPDVYFGVGSTKVYTEKLCKFYSTLGDTKYTAIRHSNIYGPYDKFDLDKCHVVPAMIVKTLDSNTDFIEIQGDSKNEAKRDILYIDDLLRFIELCLEKQQNKFELFNCGYGESFSITEIVEKIQKISNVEKAIKYNSNIRNIPTKVILDCNKAKNKLGWIPQVHINTGISNTIKWYKENYNG